MMPWRDQVAIVTGSARGIGRATARLLAQRGAAVCVNYAAHADAADELAGEIAADGGRALSVMADVAEPSVVEAMVARAERELGPVTILVNNADMSWRGTLDTYDPEQVARMIRATRAVLGGMRARRYGRYISSIELCASASAISCSSALCWRSSSARCALIVIWFIASFHHAPKPSAHSIGIVRTPGQFAMA
jgi:3-oxoacyl-[acyl-carrier protein] reductase